MSKKTPLILSPFSTSTASTPRARRGDAAVLAQYIQDITHPHESLEQAAAA